MNVEDKPIGLIIPPSAFLLDERVFPSGGLLKIAAVLERAKWNVVVIDLNGISNYVEVLEKALQEYDFFLLGITATSPQMVPVSAIVKLIRNVSPQVPIVIGGPHVSAAFASERLDKEGKGSGRGIKEMIALSKMADLLVAGDGEIAIFNVIEAIQNKVQFPLVINADDPNSAMFLTENDLNNMPFPARHLVDLSSYHYSIEGRPATSLISELGCVYNCFFCGLRNSPSFRRIRARGAESVKEELIHLYWTYGFTGYMFSDDELNVPKNFTLLMKEIIKAQEEIGQDFRLRGFIKSNLFTEEQAKLMYEAGFRNLLTGFESGSDRILININKKATRTQNTRCMEIADKYNLKVKALMSLSHSGESESTIQETEDWLLEVKPNDIDVTLITVYFGTPLADFAKPHQSIPNAWTFTVPKTGDRLHFYETDFATDDSYYKGEPGSYKCHTFSDYLSCDDLVRLRDDLENNVRRKLNIPFYAASAASRVETSMGQGFPTYVLRSTI